MTIREQDLGDVQTPPPGSSETKQAKPESILRKRWRKFRSFKRGYYSFLLILAAYAVSFVLPVLINNKPLVMAYEGDYYFPLINYHDSQEFGLSTFGEPNYRDLKAQFEAEGSANWVLMPLYPYSPNESLLELEGVPPNAPTWGHPFGTDNRARDILARLAFGFNISMTFGILVLVLTYVVGIAIGAMIGYFGGKLDMLGQRLIEIWSSLPFLYIVIIISSIVVPIYLPGRSILFQPSFWMLIVILSVFGWMGITYYIRGEFYREKAKDYIGAAIAMGASEPSIMFKHILPNALTPIVSFAPFIIVGNIFALVGLDFLGFGLPAPTPSWGELIGQGMEYLTKWWLVFFPLGAVFVTLLLIVFVGEALREAFDPKEYSRLR